MEAVERAQRREALAAVGEMAAGLAHEVRNPAAALRGAAEVLASEEEGTARAREMLEVIEEESARLGRVAGEFLEYPRPASPRREPVDLGELGALAGGPGGELMTNPTDLLAAVDRIQSRTATDVFRTPHAIWDGLATILVIIVLLAAEWWLRKRFNLL